LAVCKKVVEEHGGEIRVASKPQHGATFTVFLPAMGANA
jgi:signal transduction histidine kinase